MGAVDEARSGARAVDRASRDWLGRLAASGPARDAAIADLHALLLRATRFELRRRGTAGSAIPEAVREDLAQQSADDALVAILGKLGSFRGDSRFTTWAYKFALYEVATALRRHVWRDREVPLEREAWVQLADLRQSPHASAEQRDLFAALHSAITEDLTPHQRTVLLALALNDVPIDVLAEQLETTRGALYKVLHDARRKLRSALAARGMPIGTLEEVRPR
jgi:RNA polymerase sigma-70 factor (ECF subfamily)